MADLTHAILIEGGTAQARMEKAMELLFLRFADDPAAEDKLRAGVFEDLLILDKKELWEDITEEEPFVTAVTSEKNKTRSLVIKKEMIEDHLIPFLKQKPFASTGRACIIPDGDRMNETAQNKLLKMLEEPAVGSMIIILTENAEILLPTIRSRCIRLWLGYQIPESGKLTDDVKQLAAILIYGKKTLAEAGSILSRYEGSREEAADFLAAFQLFLRTLSVGRHSPDLITGEAEYKERLIKSAEMVEQKHADIMRESVILAEKAMQDIERGFRVRYALRGMALNINRCAEIQGGY